MSLLQLVIVAVAVLVALCLILAVAWRIQQRTGNSGWVDTIWTFGTGAVGVVAALAPLRPESWPHGRQILVAALAAVWCLRLGVHIAARTRGITDDPRYHKMAEDWGDDAPRRMFWFLQSQAVVAAVLAVAITLAGQNPDPSWRVQDWAGAAILLIGIAGEGIADWQLRRFASDPAHRGAVCDVGLWRWSRHPNYFFEWLLWISYPLIAIDLAGFNPWGWLALAAPACMYWILVNVSGIPPLEQHMLRTRGDAFRAYQQRTRAFVPLPKF